MIKHRYYSTEQFSVMSKFDSMAVCRHTASADGFICLECGSTDLFSFQSIANHKITINNGGLNLKPVNTNVIKTSNGISSIEIKHLFDSQYEKGNISMPTCGRCGGSTVEKSVVEEHCREKGCLGCWYCGKVSPLWKVEITIGNCVACMGGDNSCEAYCPNQYMREYYGIYDTKPGLFKVTKSYEE